MGWFKKRFGEASTHAGVALVANGLNDYLTGGSKMAMFNLIFGLAAIAVPEKGNP